MSITRPPLHRERRARSVFPALKQAGNNLIIFKLMLDGEEDLCYTVANI